MKIIRNLSETARIMLGGVGCLFLGFLALGLLAIALVYPFEAPLPYAAGLLWGCLLSAAKIVLLEKSLARSVDLEAKKNAQLHATVQAGLRYLLTIGVLLCVFLFPQVFGLFGTIIGVVSLQLSAYIAGAVIRRRDGRGEAVE